MRTLYNYDGNTSRCVTYGIGGVLEWQPGDGLRYLLVVSALGPEESRMVGGASGDVFVSVGVGAANWFSLVVSPGCLVHRSYVREKAHYHGSLWRDGELSAFTALINLAVGDDEYGKELLATLRKDGTWSDG